MMGKWLARLKNETPPAPTLRNLQNPHYGGAGAGHPGEGPDRLKIQKPPDTYATKPTKPPQEEEKAGFVGFVAYQAGHFQKIEGPEPAAQTLPTTAANDQQALPGNAPDPQANIPEDLREAFEERAAIMEFDGGLSREEAERQAWQLVSREWQAAGTPCGGAAGTPCGGAAGGTTTSSNPDRWAAAI